MQIYQITIRIVLKTVGQFAKIIIGRRFSRILATLPVLYRPTPHFFALIKSSCLLQWHSHLGSRHAPSPLFSDFFNDSSACSLRTQSASFSLSLSFFRFLLSLSFSFYFSFSLLHRFIFLHPSLLPFYFFAINTFCLRQNLRGYHLQLSCTHQHPRLSASGCTSTRRNVQCV